MDIPDDPLGLAVDPLPEVLACLHGWNLIERPTPSTIRLHTLVREDALRRQPEGFAGDVIATTIRRLARAETLLALSARELPDIARGLENLASAKGARPEVAQSLLRNLF